MNNMRSALLLLLGLFVCVSLGGHSLEQGDSSVTADDDAPNFQMSDKRSGNRFFVLGIDNGLKEVSASGNEVHNIPSFSGDGNIRYGVPYKALVGSTDAQCLNYTGTLSNSATLNVQFCVTGGNTTVTFGSKTLNVPASSLKFTLEVDNWPFVSSTNLLQMQAYIKLRSGEGNDVTHQSENHRRRRSEHSGSGSMGEGVDDHEEKVSFNLQSGDGLFSYPHYALCDGVEQNVTVTSWAEEHSLKFQFQFPSFTSKLVYDPIVSFSGAANLVANSFAVFFVALMAGVLSHFVH
jgi:hypothetical protein